MLNNTAINRLKPKDKRYRVLDRDNLYIEIMPSGKKIWRLRVTQLSGKRTLKTLGKYPGVSIGEARKQKR